MKIINWCALARTADLTERGWSLTPGLLTYNSYVLAWWSTRFVCLGPIVFIKDR